jgi:molybdopterin-binding protein
VKISARNQLKGTIRKIVHGPVSTEVILELGSGVHIVSVITSEAAKDLGLKEGQPAHAIIKASNVLIGVDH